MADGKTHFSTQLPELAKKTIRFWFARRHDGNFEHSLARRTIRDAQLWLRGVARTK